MFIVNDMSEYYKIVGKRLLEEGEEVQPRGNKTKELLNVSFCLTNPRSRLVYNDKRNFSLVYAIVESLMLTQPSNLLKYFGAFNKMHANGTFSDDGCTLYGAYGLRVCQTLEGVIEKLKNDSDTRQGVVPILCTMDTIAKTKDMPCTMYLQFMIRNGKLNLHTYMRSNDIIWGTPYDVFMFTTLQEIVANTLGLELGMYYHNVTSLHVYEPHYSTLRHMVEGDNRVYEINYPYTLDIWKRIGRDYLKLVDTNKYMFQDNFIADIINTEMDCRECGKLEGQRRMPEWSIPFFKRWEVKC